MKDYAPGANPARGQVSPHLIAFPQATQGASCLPRSLPTTLYSLLPDAAPRKGSGFLLGALGVFPNCSVLPDSGCVPSGPQGQRVTSQQASQPNLHLWGHRLLSHLHFPEVRQQEGRKGSSPHPTTTRPRSQKLPLLTLTLTTGSPCSASFSFGAGSEQTECNLLAFHCVFFFFKGAKREVSGATPHSEAVL